MNRRGAPDLFALLARLDPAAPLAERHLWLIELIDWVRGDARSPEAAARRVLALVQAAEARADHRQALQGWWQALFGAVDVTVLLADFGFAPRTAFTSELADRLRRKLLPATPETLDATELFTLALPQRFDAQWLSQLDEPLLDRLVRVLTPESSAGAIAPHTRWQRTVLDAINCCGAQVCATGLAPELRLRMNADARRAQPFHALGEGLAALRRAVALGQPSPLPPGDPVAVSGRTNAGVLAVAAQVREQLDACRQAVAGVYTHLNAHGISVDLVFRLRQLRGRFVRLRELLDCLVSPTPAQTVVKLLARWVVTAQDRNSLRALVAANSSLLAAKMAERSAETGENYITRTRTEYVQMLRQAAGGGALTALTTWLKFLIAGLGLGAFWGGFWSGLMYASGFIVIQLLHFTLATKQPAMTAPAMAAKLKDLGPGGAVTEFVDEVTHLVRSQVAAVLGNVVVVVPVVVLVCTALVVGTGRGMVDAADARDVLASLSPWGPTALYAAFTGVLLFTASLLAGWAENWFVLHRMDSALRYHPRITALLGTDRAARWAAFMRLNISGFASNIALGLMLGLVPAFAEFFGLGLQARHVTLSAGQLAAAGAALGWAVLREPALWWAVAAIPVIGGLNLGVSFYLAFRLALQAHNVSGVDRARIRTAIWARARQAPKSFFLPERDRPSA